MQVVGSEYRALLDQLATMRQLCDKLKHNNLRRDLDTLQSSLNKYERTSKGSYSSTLPVFFGHPVLTNGALLFLVRSKNNS